MNGENPDAVQWWKTSKGFLAVYALSGGFVLIVIRMFLPLLHPGGALPDDRILDIMTTVLFTTCIGSAFMYFYGSSSGKAAQETAAARVVDKLMDKPPTDATSPGMIAAATAAAVAAAPAAAAAAARVAAPPAAEVAAPPAAEAAAPAAAREAVAEALKHPPTP